MSSVQILSAAEQVAEHLRAEIVEGLLVGSMPGANRLAADLGVNHKTVVAALQQLENEGVLLSQGPRRRRLIALNPRKGPRPMRVGVLLYENTDRQMSILVEIQHALNEAGHTVSYAGKSLTELKMDVQSVAKLVERTDVDAWVVVAGSRSVLEWFSGQPMPIFALFGRRHGVPIASTGPNAEAASAEAVRRLLALGHRRIVKICRGERRKPGPGKTERNFLQMLSSHGVQIGDYNLPDWEETPAGLQDLLNSLFRVTPPTALIVDGSACLVATLQFLGSHGWRVPEDVSLFCVDSESCLSWCQPSIAHIHWDPLPVIRRITRWASTVSHGRVDTKSSSIPAQFVDGDSIASNPEG